jgi:hypothetical protein
MTDYVIKERATGLYYTGRPEPRRWGSRETAKRMGKSLAKSTYGGLRNSTRSDGLLIVELHLNADKEKQQ